MQIRFSAFGFSAHSFQLSPIVGRIISELILDGKTALPIKPFDIGRFQ
jgi:sarcosine oxidase subunit beta|tara:strand:- start:1116 stop:1259 length:144 start_codon:yes stop_codon:yes gene_type:complete